MTFAGHRPDAQGSVAHHDRLTALELADNESDEVSGHLHSISKDDLSFPGSRQRSLTNRPCVSDRGQFIIYHQGHLENCLECWFIPTGESTARIRGFELR